MYFVVLTLYLYRKINYGKWAVKLNFTLVRLSAFCTGTTFNIITMLLFLEY